MANKFNIDSANKQIPWENGWCQAWAERGFGYGKNLIGLYSSAYSAYRALPAGSRRGGAPPSDGNYYLIYFDGTWGGNRYGDVAVFRNGRVWSGSNVKFRKNSVTLAEYKKWIGTPQLAWSEFLGSKRIATIPAPKKPAVPPPAAKRVAQKGTFTANEAMSIRRAPSTKGNVPVDVLYKDQSVSYDSYIDAEKIRWISYIGRSGKRNYIARRRLDNGYIYGKVK